MAHHYPIKRIILQNLSLCFKETLYRTFHRCFLSNFGSFSAPRFQRRRFFRINQKQELPMMAMFANRSGENQRSLQRTFHRCFIPSFGLLGQAVSEEKIFQKLTNQKQDNCLWWPCLLTDRDEMCNLYRGPSIDASYQVSVHLAKRFQRRRFF